jgi:hypothetical protein
VVVVDDQVVVQAEQDHVRHGGVAAVEPVVDVVQCRSVRRRRGRCGSLAGRDVARRIESSV